jgi:predicted ATPase
VLESASVSYGKATPYFPVIDLLKRYAHVEDGDDSRTVRARVTGQVLTLDESLQDAIPALLALLEALPDDHVFLRLDPPQRRQRTLEALKRMLLRESQAQPLLLIFEDLHWIDSETQALLDSLVDSLPTARLVVLVNYRPEYQHRWGSKTYYTQLRLDPLPPASAAEVLQALLGDDPSLAPLTPPSPCSNAAWHSARAPTTRCISPYSPRPWGQRMPWPGVLRKPAHSWTGGWNTWPPAATFFTMRSCSPS